MKPIATNALAWIGGATAAVTVGLAALTQVGGGLGGGGVQPLTQAVLPRADSGAASPSQSSSGPKPNGSTTSAKPTQPANSATTESKSVTTDGGSTTGQCSASGAYLVYWTPAQGFRVEEFERGPGRTAKVKFRGSTQSIQITFTCVDGTPKAEIETERHSAD